MVPSQLVSFASNQPTDIWRQGLYLLYLHGQSSATLAFIDATPALKGIVGGFV
jgi:hypothetical protein